MRKKTMREIFNNENLCLWSMQRWEEKKEEEEEIDEGGKDMIW